MYGSEIIFLPWQRNHILITVQDIYYSHYSFPKFVVIFLQNYIWLFTNLNHQIVNSNGIVSSTVDLYARCDTKSSLKFLCTFTVSRGLWSTIEASCLILFINKRCDKNWTMLATDHYNVLIDFQNKNAQYW